MARTRTTGSRRPANGAASTAKAKPKSRAKATKRPAPGKKGRPAVRVRMYRQGLGDCFLLAFPKPDGGDFFVLIDCGVILGTPDADRLMKAVTLDIAATTKRIDVLVATHEHWDHVSGFDPDKKWFDGIDVGEVWLAWTEDPGNATANRLRKQRAQKLAALWMGLGQMRLRLGAAGADDPAARAAAAAALERAAQVLTFFGIDPDEPPPGEMGAAAAAAGGGKTAKAMKWVRERTPNPRFHSPGDTFALPQAGGVRVYVLGPPTDRAQLFKDLPTRSGRETYDEALAPAAARSFFGAAFLPAQDDPGVRPEFDPARPFDRKYQLDPAAAGADPFFREHYLGSGDDDPEAWRRIDSTWMAGAAEFALQLDSETNNTSLALAFELPDGRVLLFPADAQVGNWESWHADADGNKRVWKVGGKEVTAEALLNRTVLYKVGHHGSHNATLREQGLEMMTDPDLAALVPVDVYIAHEKKRWTKMPFAPLMSRLTAKTSGRLLQADQPAGRGNTAAPAGFRARVVDSKQQIQVEGPGGKPVKRPLYVEYAFP
jgi:hypothetical protein